MSISRICELTRRPFEIVAQEEDAYNYFSLPLPTLSLKERFRHQLAFVSGHNYFWRSCQVSNQKVLSVYSPQTPFPILSLDIWSDTLDSNLDYGFDYDPSLPFTEQLFELWKSVPRPARSDFAGEGNLAAHDTRFSKNSSYVSRCGCIENCWYCTSVRNSRDCCDCLSVENCELCYECIDCVDSCRLRWSEHCCDCQDSSFLFNCNKCRDCLFCANLEGKQCFVFNKPVSSEEYRKLLEQWDFSARHIIELGIERFGEFISSQAVPHIYTDNVANCSGNYIYGSEGVVDSFECRESTGLINCSELVGAKHCLDGFGFGASLENAAQFVFVGLNARNIINCVECFDDVSELAYCFKCEQSSHLFACVGLREKQFCILNKQYSKNRYFELRAEIEAQLRDNGIWGLPLSMAFSAFAYNHSAANDYMPLSKIQATMCNVLWEDELDVSKPSFLLGDSAEEPAELFSEVPDRLEDLASSAPQSPTFLCEITGRPFVITSGEIELYRKLSVAPPLRCSRQRCKQRLQRMSQRETTCRYVDGSQEKVKTAFPSKWKQPVLEYNHWCSLVANNSNV